MSSKRKILLIFLIFLQLTTVHSQLFTEVSNEKGIDYIYPGNDSQETGGGIVIIDVNNDGWEDFLQCGGIFSSKLWINHKGKKFIDETSSYGLDCLSLMYVQGAASGDYNNDGFEDLFIANFGNERMGDNMQPFLLLNINGKGFKPVLEKTFYQKGSYTSASWGDYNKDGFIDLYLTNYILHMTHNYDSAFRLMSYNPIGLRNKLYKNMNGNDFVDVSATMNVDDDGCGLVSSFTDFDNDNDQDIMILNDFGEWNHRGNRIYRNNFPENSFTDVSVETNFYNENYGMSIGPGDYDNDGDLDYFITNIGPNSFYKNENGVFLECAKDLKIQDAYTNLKDSVFGTSWSGLFFDRNNDGDLDLYISKGSLQIINPKTEKKDPDKLFENIDGDHFIDYSDSSGLDDILSNRGAAIFDYDHDGDLDILSSVIKMPWAEFKNIDQKIKLFRNNDKSKNEWIGIRLVGENHVNTSCLGCKAKLLLENGQQIKEVDGASGHGSQSTKNIYFGLGKKKSANIEIQYTNDTILKIEKLKAGHLYQIEMNGQVNIIY